MQVFGLIGFCSPSAFMHRSFFKTPTYNCKGVDHQITMCSMKTVGGHGTKTQDERRTQEDKHQNKQDEHHSSFFLLQLIDSALAVVDDPTTYDAFLQPPAITSRTQGEKCDTVLGTASLSSNLVMGLYWDQGTTTTCCSCLVHGGPRPTTHSSIQVSGIYSTEMRTRSGEKKNANSKQTRWEEGASS